MKKINEVSKIVGVSKRTLQYYDDEGILPIERTSKNHRVYDQNTLDQIWQILIYKEMGFELNEIKEMLNLSKEQKEQYFSRQIENLENKIATIKVQKGFISLIQNMGFPEKPEENSGKTYVMVIKEMREEMEKEITRRK